MSESELAFNANGDNFEIPAGVSGWRVRRMKPRGAPELVYGRDGRPLVLPIEADMDDLRAAVGQLGRYRLDPVNDDGKIVDAVPAAYIQVVKGERLHEPTETAKQDDGDSVIKEAMRLNTELAKSVIDRFPEMMSAAAQLLAAADGAGLPAREPRALAEDEEEEGTEATPVAPGLDLNALIAQVVPMIVMSLGKSKLDVASVLDWRKATPKQPKPIAATSETEPAKSESKPADALPPLDPQTMAHFIAIQSALKPEEAALARQVASELAPVELRAWFDELSKLSVPQAVQKIRVLIAGNTEAVS
jgi:hypothetical protein